MQSSEEKRGDKNPPGRKASTEQARQYVHRMQNSFEAGEAGETG